jgi:thiamine-phosphate diphosphorylase
MGVDLGLVVVTDREMAGGCGQLVEVVAAALAGGALTVLLREKDLGREERLELAEALRALGAYVIAAGADRLGGDAVHLSSTESAAVARLTGRSCHDKAEVMRSKEDYVTLSPIFPSRSKPGYGPALGVSALGMGTKKIVALGGIETPAQARACREAGAAGVAVMGAIMRAADPAAVVRGLLS